MRESPPALDAAADVVTVADFEGAAAATFELRTLLFLAAWSKHRGGSRAWPLHVVCIGEPPASVRRLASDVGASMVRRAALVLGGSRKRSALRGFEVEPQTDRLLLLDADTLVLRDLSPLVRSAGSGIAVGLATINHYTEDLWRRMYAASGVPYPGPIGTCWCADPRLATVRGLTDAARALCRRMPPYYNAGVITVPWRLRLDGRWREHLDRILTLLGRTADVWPEGLGSSSSEHALAITVESYRLEGHPVVPIPWSHHARPLLLRARVIRWAEVAIFHYHSALSPYVRSVRDLHEMLYGRKLPEVRRRIAQQWGLKAIHSPLYRLVPAAKRKGLGEFYACVDRLVQAHLGKGAGIQ